MSLPLTLLLGLAAGAANPPTAPMIGNLYDVGAPSATGGAPIDTRGHVGLAMRFQAHQSAAITAAGLYLMKPSNYSNSRYQVDLVQADTTGNPLLSAPLFSGSFHTTDPGSMDSNYPTWFQVAVADTGWGPYCRQAARTSS